MDPQATLDRIAALLMEAMSYDCAEALAGALDACMGMDLSDWLDRGGFRPAVDGPARLAAWAFFEGATTVPALRRR